MDIQKIKTYIEYVIHRDKSKLYITPYRTWAAMLVVGFALLLASFFFGYITYNRYYVQGVEETQVAQEVAEQRSEVEELKREVDNILVYFKQKEVHHRDLLENRKSFESVVNDIEETEGSQEERAESEEENLEEALTPTLYDTFREQTAEVFYVWKKIFIDPIE